MTKFRIGGISPADIEGHAEKFPEFNIEGAVRDASKFRLGSKEVEFIVHSSDEALLDLIKKTGASVVRCTGR